MKRGVEALLLVAILLVGAVLRWVYLSELRERPDFTHPAVDAGYNDYWARALASGDWTPRQLTYDPEIGKWPFLRPPGYPYALSLVYRLAGDGYVAPRVAQMILGIGSALLLYLLGRLLFGPAVGLLAAFLQITYWVLLHFEGEMLDATLLVFLTNVFLLLTCRLAYRGGIWMALVAGLAAGLTAVVRPTILSFLPVAFAWIGWEFARRKGRRAGLAAAVIFTAGVMIPILPVTARNWVVSREFVLISANGGINLLIGNNPRADGTIGNPHVQRGVPFMNSDDYPVCIKAYERLWGRPVSSSDLARYFSGKARDFMRENPGRTLWLMARKALLFWGPAELGHQKELQFDRDVSRVLALLPIGFPAIAALAAAGLVLVVARGRRSGCGSSGTDEERARRAAILFLVLFVAVSFGSLLFFFMTAQYRLPVIPVLVLFAAAGVVEAFRSLRGQPALAALWVVVAAGVFALASVRWVNIEPEQEKWYFSEASAWEKEGQPAKADAAYVKALEINPKFSDALINLGILRAKAGRLDDAEALFVRALDASPTAFAHANLGRLKKIKGERDDAYRHYVAALDLNPLYEIALNNFGVLLLEDGRLAEAEEKFRAAIDIRPNWPDPRINLVETLRRQQRYEEARACLEQAIAEFPEIAERVAPALQRLRQEQAGP